MAQCYKELAGSPAESWGPDGLRATRRVVVPWDQREAMVLEVLGDGYEFSAQGQADYPTSSAVKAVRVRSKPLVDSPDFQGDFAAIQEELNSYGLAELTLEYEVIEPDDQDDNTPDLENDTFLTYTLDFGGEMMTLPKTKLVWEDDSTAPIPEKAQAALRIPIIEHHLTIRRVLTPPWAAIRESVGLVNSGEFLGIGAGQLLFDGVRGAKEFIQIDELTEPQYGWRLEYVFRQKTIRAFLAAGATPKGWNHQFRDISVARPIGWDRLLANGKPMYASTDFDPLFVGAAQI